MACGELTSVPTAVFELDTPAPTVAMPPRNCVLLRKDPTSPDVSDAVHTYTRLSADNVVVEKLPGNEIQTPTASGSRCRCHSHTPPPTP